MESLYQVKCAKNLSFSHTTLRFLYFNADAADGALQRLLLLFSQVWCSPYTLTLRHIK